MKYQPEYEGEIMLAGREVRDFSSRELYDIVGLLNQNESILNATMEDNITLFQPQKAQSKEYKELIKNLNLTKLAETAGSRKLGDFGDTISGGEKQRIALARVLLRNPKVLILDEPMTGLDAENQKLLSEFIFTLRGITRIIITHDNSKEYLEKFDEVICL